MDNELLYRAYSIHAPASYLPVYLFIASFSLIFSTESLMVLFLETMRLTNFKLCTHLNNGSLYGGLMHHFASIRMLLFI